MLRIHHVEERPHRQQRRRKNDAKGKDKDKVTFDLAVVFMNRKAYGSAASLHIVSTGDPTIRFW